MSSIPWLDILVAGTLLAGLVLGLCAGFKRIVLRLVHYAASIYLVVRMFHPVRRFVFSHITEPNPLVADVTTGIGLFLAVYLLLLLCIALIRRAVRQVMHSPLAQIDRGIQSTGLKPLDRIMGGAVGLLLSAVPVGLLMTVLYFNPHPQAQAAMKDSTSGSVACEFIDELVAVIPQADKDRLAATARKAKNSAIRRLAQSISRLIERFGNNVDEKLGDEASQSDRKNLGSL